MAEGLLPYGYAKWLVNTSIFVADPEDEMEHAPRYHIRAEEPMEITRIQPPALLPDARGMFFIIIDFPGCAWPKLRTIAKTLIKIDIEDAANEPELLYMAVHAIEIPGIPDPMDLVVKIDVSFCLRYELRQVLAHQTPHILCMRAMELIAAYAY